MYNQNCFSGSAGAFTRKYFCKSCCTMLLMISAVTLIALTGCNGKPQSPVGRWVLKNSQTQPSISLLISENGDFSGHGGVNRYFGKLAIPFDGGKFTIKGTPGVTMMFGPDLDKEQKYLKTFIAADRWAINSSGELELYSKDKKTAVLIYKQSSNNGK